MEQQVVLSPEDWSVVRITLSNESTRKRANQPEKADRLLAVLQRIEAQTRKQQLSLPARRPADPRARGGEMEHIKGPHDGPWETPGTDGEDRVICYRDRKGRRRTVAHVYGETETERDARADLIVRAVNAYEGVMEALRDLLTWADAPGVAVKPGYVAEKARAAIAKATEAQNG